jgi:hypothetical protein
MLMEVALLRDARLGAWDVYRCDVYQCSAMFTSLGKARLEWGLESKWSCHEYCEQAPPSLVRKAPLVVCASCVR